MTRSLYIIGGAGTGKSTFTGQVMDNVVMAHCVDLEDLCTRPNSRGTQITLRGHRLNGYTERSGEGIYLGAMREEFPGTDGLDRVSYIPGEAWLIDGAVEGTLPDFIIAEGATLAVRRFLKILHRTTDLLIIFLTAEDFVKDLRFCQRGSTQDDGFVKATATRSQNLAVDMAKEGIKVWEADSADPAQWNEALSIACDHLR